MPRSSRAAKKLSPKRRASLYDHTKPSEDELGLTIIKFQLHHSVQMILFNAHKYTSGILYC